MHGRIGIMGNVKKQASTDMQGCDVDSNCRLCFVLVRHFGNLPFRDLALNFCFDQEWRSNVNMFAFVTLGAI